MRRGRDVGACGPYRGSRSREIGEEGLEQGTYRRNREKCTGNWLDGSVFLKDGPVNFRTRPVGGVPRSPRSADCPFIQENRPSRLGSCFVVEADGPAPPADRSSPCSDRSLVLRNRPFDYGTVLFEVRTVERIWPTVLQCTGTVPPRRRNGSRHGQDRPSRSDDGPPQNEDGPSRTEDGPPKRQDGPSGRQNIPPNRKDRPPHEGNGAPNCEDGPPNNRVASPN